MGSNSFPTGDGGHVGGIVVMAIDAKGNAVPVDARPVTLDQFCRALAIHAMIVKGEQGVDKAEERAHAILAFALAGKDAP